MAKIVTFVLAGVMTLGIALSMVACKIIVEPLDVSDLKKNKYEPIDNLVNNQETKRTLRVLFDKNLSEAEAKMVQSKISRNWNVTHCEFISKEQALLNYAESLGEEHRELVAGLGDQNPLRHRCDVTLMNIMRADETVALIKKIPGVSDVKS